MKRTILCLIGVILGTCSFSQSIKSYAITSAGTALMSPEGAIYLSIGEPLNTEVSDGEIMISQGFLNVTIAGSILDVDEWLTEEIKAYPNPASTTLTIEIPEMKGEYFYELYNLNGTLLEKTKILSSKEAIAFTDKISGGYYMRVIKDNKSSKTLKITKI